MPEPLPYQMSERELVVRFLRRRADFWGRFPAHHDAAGLLRREADLIDIGRHDKLHAEQPKD